MNKKSWFIRYFVSYLIIAMIPIIIFGCVFYYMNVVELNKRVLNNNCAALKQSLDKLDYLVEKMSNISYHFTSSSLENNIQYNDFRSFSIVEDSNIVQQLKSYKETLGVPANVFLYIRGDTCIYTNEGKYPYAVFEDMLKKDGDLTMAQFYTTISSTRHNTSMNVPAFEDEPYNGGLTVYLYPLPYMDVLPIATLGFMFKENDVQNIIQNYLGEIKGNIYIYNEYLQEIFNFEQIPLNQEAKSGYANMKGEDILQQHIDGIDYVVMRDVSQNSGFSIIAVTKEKDFYNQVNLMQIFITLLIIILLLIAAVQARIMSEKNYRPLKRLVVHMSKMFLSGTKVCDNEFDLIESCLNNVENENRELHYLVNRQKPMVVSSCLNDLLKGKISTYEDLNMSIKCTNIDLSNPYIFVMLIFPMDRCSKDALKQTHDIISITEECILPYGRLYGVELISENKVAVISSCNKKEVDGEEVRARIARLIQKNIMEKFGFKTQIAVGRIYEDIFQINSSFMEAMVVVSDYMPAHNIDVAFFEDITAVMTSEQQNDKCNYPVIEQALYIQSIKQANETVALKALNEMIYKISEADSFVITQCLCYDIINLMVKTSKQVGNEIKLGDIKSLCTFASLAEFSKRVSKLTIQICRQYEQFKDREDAKMRSELINYINSHFCDTDISLESVADHFGISVNYLSRLFKQETGYGFIEYITILRMDRVKAQLIYTDYQIKDIVRGVGYLDIASFNRKFKSYEGITPGQYRAQMRIGSKHDNRDTMMNN